MLLIFSFFLSFPFETSIPHMLDAFSISHMNLILCLLSIFHTFISSYFNKDIYLSSLVLSSVVFTLLWNSPIKFLISINSFLQIHNFYLVIFHRFHVSSKIIHVAVLDQITCIILMSMSDNSNIWIHVGMFLLFIFLLVLFMGTFSNFCLTAEHFIWKPSIRGLDDPPSDMTHFVFWHVFTVAVVIRTYSDSWFVSMLPQSQCCSPSEIPP